MENSQLRELKEDFNIWYKSPDKSFLYINERSRVFPRWLSYQEVVSDLNFTNSILKPINLYAKKLYPGPKLISIDGNEILLQQGNHAEMFLLQNKKEFYNIDRPWVRQYYLTEDKKSIMPNCFPGVFRFYVPWIIDADVDVQILQPENSPFLIEETKISFKKVSAQTDRIDPEFVNFRFKSIGSHIVEDGFGKIPRQSPMFNLRFLANDIIVNEIKEYYGYN
jgi:hypothetical protein